MTEVKRLREKTGVTQTDLARAGGTSQPAIAAYEASRKSPTLGTLRRLARGVGMEMTVEFHPPLTREERRSLVLHREIADRLQQDPQRVLGRARSTLARMRQAVPGAAPLLEQWDALLKRRPEDLAFALTDMSPLARELRQVTPFAGVLSARERAAAYRRFRDEEARRP